MYPKKDRGPSCIIGKRIDVNSLPPSCILDFYAGQVTNIHLTAEKSTLNYTN